VDLPLIFRFRARESNIDRQLIGNPLMVLKMGMPLLPIPGDPAPRSARSPQVLSCLAMSLREFGEDVVPASVLPAFRWPPGEILRAWRPTEKRPKSLLSLEPGPGPRPATSLGPRKPRLSERGPLPLRLRMSCIPRRATMASPPVPQVGYLAPALV